MLKIQNEKTQKFLPIHNQATLVFFIWNDGTNHLIELTHVIYL